MRFIIFQNDAKDLQKHITGQNYCVSFYTYSFVIIISVFIFRSFLNPAYFIQGYCSQQSSPAKLQTGQGSIKQRDETAGRINFHKSYKKNQYMVVEGKIQPGIFADANIESAKDIFYPVVLDTGASQPIFLSEKHIKENQLTVYSKTDNLPFVNGYKLGLCKLTELTIGNVRFENWKCYYFKPKESLCLKNGLVESSVASSNWGEDVIILGLPLLMQFKYILFDNINRQAELSYYQLFEPNKRNWERYRLHIEEDFHGNAYLYVDIPVADKEIELQLDTGSGRGLAIGERLWGQIKGDVNKLSEVKFKRGKIFYPYINTLYCDKGIAEKLKVGRRIIKNAEISVFSDDSELLEVCDGMLGMQYFQNTVIVLDFDRQLLWVMNDDD